MPRAFRRGAKYPPGPHQAPDSDERRRSKLTTRHPKRRTFYSFHFDNDAWRAGQVRNIGATEHDEPVSDNSWEQVKRGGDAAIKKWIEDQMSTRSCVIVLIGSQTASRKWVDYEIRKAWNDKKGLLGIYIHRLLDQNRRASHKGTDPFSNIQLQNGRTLNQYVAAYDPPYVNSQDVYGYIKNRLEGWVEDAIKNRLQ